MVRRTVDLLKSVDKLVRTGVEEGKSSSVAVTRLVEAGGRVLQIGRPPRYVAPSVGPEGLGMKADEYLRAPVSHAQDRPDSAPVRGAPSDRPILSSWRPPS